MTEATISNPDWTRSEDLRPIRANLDDALAEVRQARVRLDRLLARDVAQEGTLRTLLAQVDLAKAHLERALYDILHEREREP